MRSEKRTAPTPRNGLQRRALAGVAAVLVLGSCEADGVYTAPIEDEVGRQCVLVCPADEPFCTTTCDAGPMREDCRESEEPGFWAKRGPAPDHPTLLCEACFFEGDRVLDPWLSPLVRCAQLVCEQPEDCGFSQQVCIDDLCWLAMSEGDGGRDS